MVKYLLGLLLSAKVFITSVGNCLWKTTAAKIIGEAVCQFMYLLLILNIKFGLLVIVDISSINFSNGTEYCWNKSSKLKSTEVLEGEIKAGSAGCSSESFIIIVDVEDVGEEGGNFGLFGAEEEDVIKPHNDICTSPKML